VGSQSLLLASGLAERGFTVDLVAHRDTKLPSGNLIPSEDDEEKTYERYRGRLKEYDQVIDLSNLKYTYLYKEEHPELRLIGAVYPTQVYATPPRTPFPSLVCVSEAHAQSLSRRLGVATRVIPYATPPPERLSTRDGRLLYLGRMVSGKGPQLAIDVARQLRTGIDLCGSEEASMEGQRFAITLLTRCDGRLARFFGRVRESFKRELLSRARVAVLPYLEDERAYACLPIIEALSHGVPVVTMNKGCSGEYVKDGYNGFVAEKMEELPDAVKRAELIPAEDCAESVKQFHPKPIIERWAELIKSGAEW
jgi:glycosyltransferase involved in cell wall biosynthesis